MAASLIESRAAEIAKYLMDIKIPQTREQITAHFKWGKNGTQRSMPLVISWGILIVDETRVPHTFQYKKGSQINFYPPFSFTDTPEKEMDIQEMCKSFLEKTTSNWETPQLSGYPEAVILAAIYGMGEEEMEWRQTYNEWLDAIAAKLRQYYLAYRMVESIKAMPVRERRLERWGVNNKLKGQDKDDHMSMSLNFRPLYKQTLDGIK